VGLTPRWRGYGFDDIMSVMDDVFVRGIAKPC
jgi:hypothetical protein